MKQTPQSLGGKARADTLTPNERKAIARKGGQAAAKKRRERRGK